MNAVVTPADAPAAPRTNRGALYNPTIRQRTTGEKAAERAVLMRRLRIALPIGALVLIAAFFLNTRTGGGDDAFLDDFADLEATPQNLSTANPQFSGVDARGNPYEITAASASRKPESEEIIELDAPRAVTAGADAESIVAAKAGVFNTDEKRLLLKDGVTFEHAAGLDNYVLKTPQATVSIDDQTVVSDGGVAGDGPRGSKIEADRMNADNREGIVVFEGNVRMRIYPAKTAAPADPAPTDENGEVE